MTCESALALLDFNFDLDFNLEFNLDFDLDFDFDFDFDFGVEFGCHPAKTRRTPLPLSFMPKRQRISVVDRGPVIGDIAHCQRYASRLPAHSRLEHLFSLWCQSDS